jgi:hypothetical protein
MDEQITKQMEEFNLNHERNKALIDIMRDVYPNEKEKIEQVERRIDALRELYNIVSEVNDEKL